MYGAEEEKGSDHSAAGKSVRSGYKVLRDDAETGEPECIYIMHTLQGRAFRAFHPRVHAWSSFSSSLDNEKIVHLFLPLFSFFLFSIFVPRNLTGGIKSNGRKAKMKFPLFRFTIYRRHFEMSRAVRNLFYFPYFTSLPYAVHGEISLTKDWPGQKEWRD